tara:strand:- start:153 stop:428 length:276 start_codon:yes stop_codon:yes gene_type:complete
MSEYDDVVERQRLLLEAEAWAKNIKSIHVHSLTSMYYETEFTQKEIEVNGAVTDTEYNNGIITRHRGGKLVHTFGEQLFGEELLNSYIRNI